MIDGQPLIVCKQDGFLYGATPAKLMGIAALVAICYIKMMNQT